MNGSLACLAVGMAIACAAPAMAFPDGAPWDAHLGEGCAECHFTGTTVPDSPALAIEGLPDRLAPGGSYPLTLSLDGPNAVRSGFLFVVLAEAGEAGRLIACAEGIEARGAAARSTGAQPPWRLEWQAPDPLPQRLRFVLWANAADGDGSPFGDRIHHRTLVLEPGR